MDLRGMVLDSGVRVLGRAVSDAAVGKLLRQLHER